MPLLGCTYLFVSAIKKQQFKTFIIATQGIFIGILLVLIGFLFIFFREKFNFSEISSYQEPYNLAFYGVQVIGVIGSFLTTYVKALPKK